MTQQLQFASPSIGAKIFALAGNATFTLRSKRTGTHFTFRVQKKNEKPAFVSVLSGPDNESDYRFLGTIFADGSFRHGRKSGISQDAPSAKAFEWFWKHVDSLPEDKIEFQHACKCCRCGRTLTTPESASLGYGPECAKYIGL